MNDSQFEQVQSRLDLLASKYRNVLGSSSSKNNNNNNTNNHVTEPVTPMTFTMERIKRERVNCNKNGRNENSNNNDNRGNANVRVLTHISKSEFTTLPAWIKGQFSSIETINTCIDEINDFLAKTGEQTITKNDLQNLMQNKKEKTLLLLLSQTNRLKSEWIDGISVYSVIANN